MTCRRPDDTLPLFTDDTPPPRLPPTPAEWERTRTALEAIAGDHETMRDWAKGADVGRPHWTASRYNVSERYELARAIARAATQAEER